MKSLAHSAMVQPLKLGNEYVNWSQWHNFAGMWLLIHSEIKAKPSKKKGHQDKTNGHGREKHGNREPSQKYITKGYKHNIIIDCQHNSPIRVYIEGLPILDISPRLFADIKGQYNWYPFPQNAA